MNKDQIIGLIRNELETHNQHDSLQKAAPLFERLVNEKEIFWYEICPDGKIKNGEECLGIIRMIIKEGESKVVLKLTRKISYGENTIFP